VPCLALATPVEAARRVRTRRSKRSDPAAGDTSATDDCRSPPRPLVKCHNERCLLLRRETPTGTAMERLQYPIESAHGGKDKRHLTVGWTAAIPAFHEPTTMRTVALKTRTFPALGVSVRRGCLVLVVKSRAWSYSSGRGPVSRGALTGAFLLLARPQCRRCAAANLSRWWRAGGACRQRPNECCCGTSLRRGWCGGGASAARACGGTSANDFALRRSAAGAGVAAGCCPHAGAAAGLAMRSAEGAPRGHWRIDEGAEADAA